MKRLHLIGLGVLVLAFAGQTILSGGAQQNGDAQAAGPFDTLHFRSIGPASMSGRISDLAVYEANPAIFYVGTAHGGVWKTINNGTTFEAQFQDQGLMSIGDVDDLAERIPTSSGSAPASRTTARARRGATASTSRPTAARPTRTWACATSRHINRIVIDPRNNDIVFVAATGSLWGPGGERGVYKTTDGGRTWKQVLKVDDDTGANDLVMDPTNSQILYASTYQRRRTAVLHERRRAGQRHLEVDRRRRDLDPHQGRRRSIGRSAASRSTSTASGRTFSTR